MSKSPGAIILRNNAREYRADAADYRALGGVENQQRATNLEYLSAELDHEARALELMAAGVGQ